MMFSCELEAKEKEMAKVGIRLDELAQERDECRDALREARRERIAIIDSEMAGDPGIAWTNEERAEADYDAAVERYEEMYQRQWELNDDLLTP